jgi:pimeloyl-ACP methyl ester carboxylesterase
MVSAPLYSEEERVQRHARNRPLEIKPDGSHNAERFRFLWQFYGDDVPPEILARNFAESLRGGPMSWWGHRAAFTYPMKDRLALVRQPVLVLNPDDDLAQQTPRAKGLLRNGRIHHLPGFAHGMLDVHTAEIARVVRSFLDRSDG